MFAGIFSIVIVILLGYVTDIQGAIIYFLSGFIAKRWGLIPSIIIFITALYLGYSWWYFVLLAQVLIISTFEHYALKHIDENTPVENVESAFNMIQIICGTLAIIGTIGCIASLLK